MNSYFSSRFQHRKSGDFCCINPPGRSSTPNGKSNAIMENQALLDGLLTRRSCRAYNERKVDLMTLQKILHAGTFAPSGRNSQSATFVAIQNPELIAELEKRDAEVSGNPGVHRFYGANTIVAVLADPQGPTHVYDGALAMGNLMLAAHALDVKSCWIHHAKDVFATEWGKELLRKWGLPDRLEGIAFCLLGYEAKGGVGAAAPRRNDAILIVS